MGASNSKIETGHTCNTAYTRWVWAYNSCGNSTSVALAQSTSECLFSCGQLFTDNRDNKSYNTVQVGTQCWMAQNLNTGTRINGSQGQTNNSLIEKYCFNDLESNCNINGGLYQWNEMMQYVTTAGVQGICPTGWHLPADAEWTTVSTFLGGEGVAGAKMKSTGTIESGTGLWFSPNNGATNESGFTAVPGGHLDTTGTFNFMGSNGFWWSSSESGTGNAWYRLLSYYYITVYRNNYSKNCGVAVRCLRD